MMKKMVVWKSLEAVLEKGRRERRKLRKKYINVRRRDAYSRAQLSKVQRELMDWVDKFHELADRLAKTGSDLEVARRVIEETENRVTALTMENSKLSASLCAEMSQYETLMDDFRILAKERDHLKEICNTAGTSSQPAVTSYVCVVPKVLPSPDPNAFENATAVIAELDQKQYELEHGGPPPVCRY